jgi:type II secretory pathway pseudopilin PulG
MDAPDRRGRRAAGSALLEALVALAIVGVALLFLSGLLTHEARLTLRAERQREALEALEGVLAGVRSGALPLRDAIWTEAEPPWVRLPPGRPTLRLEVRRAGDADLWDVTVSIRYVAWNQHQTRTLATRVWRPSARP